MRTGKVAALAALGALLLGGCGGGGKDSAPPVASLGGGSSTAQASSPASGQRPQARLDTTKDELKAWEVIWVTCLENNGLPPVEQKLKDSGRIDPKTIPSAAAKACAAKEPIRTPPEMDPQKNPEYKQDSHAWVKCMQNQGMPVIEDPDQHWHQDMSRPKPSDAKFEEVINSCRIEAFSKKN